MRLEANKFRNLLPFSKLSPPSQSRACFDGLVRQIPLLYLVVLANFIGMLFVTDVELVEGFSPLYLLVGVVLWRLLYWVKLKDQALSIAEIRSAIGQTAAFAFVISIGFAVWGHYLISTQPDVIWLVILFASLAATGAAYGLMSFPLVAAVPIIILCVSFAIRLLFLGRHDATVVGFCLALVSILIMRILSLQSRAMQELVAGRLELENERRNLVRAERTAALAARTDALTGLSNRRAFMEVLCENLADQNKPMFTLALVDLDEFKPINDSFGHNAGDAILKGIAENLVKEAPEGAFLARIGGDEFAVLAPQLQDADAAKELGEILCEIVSKPVEFQGRQHSVRASCGMAIISQAIEVSAAMQCADQALYKAKDSISRVQVFGAELQVALQRRALIERNIVTGAITNELQVAFQPIINLRQPGQIMAFEALARWTNEELGDVGPAEFIPIAEGADAIAAISERCISIACKEINRVAPSARLSFNLSAIELCDARSCGRILTVLDQYHISPQRVQFEVTETAPLSDLAIARKNIDHLREAGCLIALDDFGAGNASITYLREMHFDVVKLDGSLIEGIVNSVHCRQLLKATIDLCHTMGMECVAEMVETEEQLRLVEALGCDAAQGNYLAAPSRSLSTSQSRELRYA